MNQQTLNQSRGLEKAEKVLKNGYVLNVFTNEWIKTDIAIKQDTIIGIGNYHGKEEIDMTGKYIVPGFIDAHLHIESSMTTPVNLMQELLPWGTTTLIADPHEIANVQGLPGIQFMLEQSKKAEGNIYIMLPSCVPATPFEDSGATLKAEDLLNLKQDPHVLGLAEMMNFVGVLENDAEVHQKLTTFKDQIIDGHAPLVLGKDLQAYVLSGISTEHECTSGEEALEKLRSGLFIWIREGSAAKNLVPILTYLLKQNISLHRIAFCTDDKHIEDIRKEGTIRASIQKSIALGLDPIIAYKAATYTPANCYGLNHLGAIAAGYQADLVVLNDIHQVTIDTVYVKGNQIIKQENPVPETTLAPQNSVHLKPITKQDLQIKLKSDTPNIIELIPNQLLTKKIQEKVTVENDLFIPNQEYQKIVVLERHHSTGKMGKGIVKGLNLHGAIASTVAHDSHNLVVIGDNDEDIFLAIQEIQTIQGGFVLVQDKTILGELPLPIAGLMTNNPVTQTQTTLKELTKIARNMGVPEEYDPFVTMSFLSLPVIPEIKITDRGLFDTTQYQFIEN